MESYKEFASIYDKLMGNIDYKLWFDYIEEIFSRRRINPKYILEMACGTGSLTELLCQKYYDITCFDISENMLTVAYDKLRKYNNVNVLNQDMVDFHLNKKFNAIVCICDSINYITEYNDVKKTFNNVYNHLDDNGIFIFDINSYHKIKNIISKNIFINDEDDIFYTWESFFDDENSLCQYFLTFFVKQGELYKRFNEVHNQRAYTIEEIVYELEKVGFRNISCFDGFTFNDVNKHSERINFIASK